jgi:hypothetical protein
MSGHTVIHPGPGASMKAHVFNAHLASLEAHRLLEHRDRIAAVLFGARSRCWVTEEAARANRRRSLIDDNPASG